MVRKILVFIIAKGSNENKLKLIIEKIWTRNLTITSKINPIKRKILKYLSISNKCNITKI